MREVPIAARPTDMRHRCRAAASPSLRKNSAYVGFNGVLSTLDHKARFSPPTQPVVACYKFEERGRLMQGLWSMPRPGCSIVIVVNLFRCLSQIGGKLTIIDDCTFQVAMFT